MTLEYAKHKIVSLREYFDEKWLQNHIEDDPSILGLGELNVIERERKQSTGGRLDFLLFDAESNTMYETEIQLGATDESHIIRSIEYWDIERRRYPSKEHKAVIVAEGITNRFFNVIALMNRSIPIIAIQLSAIEIDNRILLSFTKVLDIYEEPEDDEAIPGETVDRSYWESKVDSKSLAIADKFIELFCRLDSHTRVTYNKGHIAIGTNRRNFCWPHPRKREGHCYVQIRVGTSNIDQVRELLDEAGISFVNKKEDHLSFKLHPKLMDSNWEILSRICTGAHESYK